MSDTFKTTRPRQFLTDPRSTGAVKPRPVTSTPSVGGPRDPRSTR
jgi:hypothetical protein